ncbi:MAG TPA: helix-turn-helix transcriptional regulator [Longimicrobium sp.]|jgi:AraC-like DNA-binding protein
MTALLYREHDPPPALAARVECLWTMRSDGALSAPAVNRVLPDGCIDLIFDFGEPAEGAPRSGPRGYAVGAMTRAVPVHVAGRVEIVGVRFRPGAAALGLPAGELTDLDSGLDELGLGSLCAPVLDAGSALAAVPVLAELLAARFRDPPEPIAAAAWARLRSTAGALPVRELAAQLGVGERRLQRIFHDHVGLTPKQAARVARLNAAIALMTRAELPLGRVALRAGYYDQAHFNHEFARLAGVAPHVWRAERVASVQASAAGAP